MEPFKLNIKFPDGSEFNAEGPQEIVQQAFDQFLEGRKAQAANAEFKKPPADPAAPGLANSTLSPVTDLLPRYYEARGDNISLKILPTTEKAEADALLMIIYAYRVMKNQYEVTAARLAIGARQSGIQTDRMDRAISTHSQYVTKAGVKKGMKYGLNNPGVRYVEDLLKKGLE